jgi:hypothetical protein
MPKKDVCLQLVEDTKGQCKNGELIIPASLGHRAVAWYHHYLPHLGHSCLEKTMRSIITGKVCVLPSRGTSNLADLARLTRDIAYSMDMFHPSLS